MARKQTAEDAAEVENASDGTDIRGNPSPAQASDPELDSGVLVETIIRARAPSIEAIANYFDAKAAKLEDMHGGEATGRGAKEKAKGQGMAEGYRDAAEFLRNVEITG